MKFMTEIDENDYRNRVCIFKCIKITDVYKIRGDEYIDCINCDGYGRYFDTKNNKYRKCEDYKPFSSVFTNK